MCASPAAGASTRSLDEHPEGRGVRIDYELPIYSSKEGAGLNLVTYWSHECRQPWQTASWLARQKADHIAKGRVSTWLRLFENRWVSGESMFVTAELWDAIVDHKLTPASPAKGGAKLYIGLDVGIKNDTTGIVAVKKVKAPDGTSRIHLVHTGSSRPSPAPRWTTLTSRTICGGCIGPSPSRRSPSIPPRRSR